MDNMDVENFDVIVVGAGWYGLVAAHTYLELAPHTNLLIVDDSATVGGVWSQERIYPSLYAQISHPLFEYSFYPMPKEGISPDGFVSGTTIHKYLHDFAVDHNLMDHIRLKTRVEEVRREVDGGRWLLRTTQGHSLACGKLIYATGANSSPIIPEWAKSKVGFEKPVIHSLEMGSQLDYIADNVNRATVVGRSKSSYDTVFHLLKEGKKVDWVMRDGASGPFGLYAPTFIGLWNIADHISTRLASSFSPCVMNTSGRWNAFLQRTWAGQALMDVYWTFANFLSSYHAEYSKSPDAEKLRPRPYSDGVFWGSGGVGIATVPNFWKVFHEGNVTVHSTEVESLSHGDVVNLRDGHCYTTDIVIHCTGFDKGYTTFTLEQQDELGLHYDRNEFSKWNTLEEKAGKVVDELLPYLKMSPVPSFDPDAGKRLPQGPNRHYRRLVVPHLAAQGDRSILFPGHIHSAFTPLAAELQALWGVTWMLGWRDLPSQEEMEMEAATFNAWTRKRYLEQGKKHSYFIYDYLPYIDTLMKDLGLNPNRKKNMFEELFVRYKPSDYRGLLDEYMALRRQQVGKGTGGSAQAVENGRASNETNKQNEAQTNGVLRKRASCNGHVQNGHGQNGHGQA